MDRFFVDKNNINLENNTCVILGEDVKHISKVLRCKIGEKLEICDKDNSEYICEITDINKEQVDLDIIEKREIKRESDLKVKLYQGLPKSTKMELILQKLTEVGVDEIILVSTKRSVVKVDDKKEGKKIERWERIMYEAAKQSKRGKIPKLRGILSFKEALVGPEGGFEEEEIENIQDINSKVVSLGPRILRTETASVVASSIVLYELSDLGGNI